MTLDQILLGSQSSQPSFILTGILWWIDQKKDDLIIHSSKTVR